jgi:dihydropteroate synthase
VDLREVLNNQQFNQWCQHYTSQPKAHLQKPLVMGIINVTPDSFYDGGVCFQQDMALKQARQMIAAGVDVLDIGGESSRPGALPVSLDEELTRVIPLIEAIRAESDVCISIDTTKAEVMQRAVCAGAGMINDIMALQTSSSLKAALELQVPVCLMHMQGTPRTMQESPHYFGDVIEEINDFFDMQVERCLNAGMHRWQLLLDPGFGFGKSVQHNLKIIKRMDAFMQHNLPIMLGVSRKSTLGAVLGKPANERLLASVALNVIATLNGVAMIRTHDVEETKQALLMTKAIMEIDNQEQSGDSADDTM